MASVYTSFIVFISVLFLIPGHILSIPPGPNKKWLFGGQVTFLNSLVHAAIIAGIVFLFAQ